MIVRTSTLTLITEKELERKTFPPPPQKKKEKKKGDEVHYGRKTHEKFKAASEKNDKC